MSGVTRTRRAAGAAPGCLLVALLGVGVFTPTAGPAAVWPGTQEPVSGDVTLSRTTPSNRFFGILPDGSLYATWYARTGSRTSEVRGARRLRDGQWEPEASAISLGDSLARLPTLAVGPAGQLHVAWVDNRNGNEDIYYRSRDAAGTWGPEERLTRTPESSLSPVVAAAANGWVHVAWSEGGPGHLRLVVLSRPPEGAWPLEPRVVTDGSGNSENPSMQVDASGRAHLVWQDNIINPIPNVDDPGNVEIYYVRVGAEGVPETAPFRVSNAIGRSQRPTIAAEPNGTLHVFWCDNRDRGSGGTNGFPIAIWYRRSLPGLGFGHEKRFVYAPNDRLNPMAAVDARGTINVVWEDYAVGNGDIYFRQITPSGGWDPFTTQLTATSGASQAPALLAEPDGTLHLLWSDLLGADDLNVYYRRGQADATTPVTLRAVAARTTADAVELSFSTSSEIENAGFMVYDAPGTDAEAEVLTPRLLPGGQGEYRVTFSRAQAPAGSVLKLVSVSRAGEKRVEAVLTVAPAGDAASPLALLRPYPNPSSAVVQFPLRAPAAGELELRIVDVSGRVVRRLLTPVEAGEVLTLTWDGRDDGGRRVPAGRYFSRGYQAGRPIGAGQSLLRLP